MDADPKVSIAMPVYNGGRHFELALQSALAQTYPNVEIVVVNDGSNDGGATEAIASRYKDRIKYIAQENKGVAGALNSAIANMSGDIFTWLSHDDLFEPEKTAIQVSYYKRMGRADAILCSDWTFIDDDGKVMHEVTHDHARLVEAPMLAMLIPVINGCTLFIPRHILEDVGPFEEKYRFTQDYQLWNKILRRHDFFHVAKKLVRYRIHPEQDSNKPGAAVEGDALWIKIMDDRSETERVQMFGSSKRFFERMGLYFQPSPYRQASEHALARSRSCIGDTLVSVIVPVDADRERARTTLMSVLCQTHAKLEVLLIAGKDAPLDLLDELAGLDGRVRIVRETPAAAPPGAFNAGLWAAEGTYLAFAPAGSRMFPHRLERQMRAMQDAGRVLCQAPFASAPDSPENGKAQIAETGTAVAAHRGIERERAEGRFLSTLMVHGSLVSEGLAVSSAGTPDGALEVAGLSPRHNCLTLDEALGLGPGA